MSIEEEVTILNNNISKNKELPIIVYGENACDDTVDKKCQQLLGLGFKNIYVYPGGLFEWLILQDIYGDDAEKVFQENLASRSKYFTLGDKPEDIDQQLWDQIKSAKLYEGWLV